jgi:NitT/TauT family transport system substrate-binding protein
LLARHGLSIKDVMVVVHGAAASAIASIEHSKVDAGNVNGSSFAVLKRRTAAIRVLADPRAPARLKEDFGVDSIATFCLFSTPQWIAGNRDTVRRATRALMKTHAWIRSHSADQIRERLPAQFRTSDSEVDVEILQSLMQGLSPDGRMPAALRKNARKVYAVSIDELRNLDLSHTWTNEFVEAR